MVCAFSFTEQINRLYRTGTEIRRILSIVIDVVHTVITRGAMNVSGRPRFSAFPPRHIRTSITTITSLPGESQTVAAAVPWMR